MLGFGNLTSIEREPVYAVREGLRDTLGDALVLADGDGMRLVPAFVSNISQADPKAKIAVIIDGPKGKAAVRHRFPVKHAVKQRFNTTRARAGHPDLQATPGGAGTHTGHTGHTGARGQTDHTDDLTTRRTGDAATRLRPQGGLRYGARQKERPKPTLGIARAREALLRVRNGQRRKER